MNCERGDLLIGLLEPSTTAPEDAALSPAERAEAEAHVATCPACREALRAYRGLATALRAGAATGDEAPAPEATARAYAAVLEAMQAGGAGGVRLLAGGATRAQAGGRVGMRRPGAWLTGFAAAACLLLVAGLVLAPRRDASAPVAAQRQHEDAAAQAEPAEARRASAPPAAPAQADDARSEVAGAREEAAADAFAGARERLDDAEKGLALEAQAAPARGAAPAPPSAAPPAADEADSTRETARARGADAQRPGGGAPRPMAASGPPAPAREPAPPAPPDGAADLAPAANKVREVQPVAAWRVGERVVVLERAGEALTARAADPAPLAGRAGTRGGGGDGGRTEDGDRALRGRRAPPAQPTDPAERSRPAAPADEAPPIDDVRPLRPAEVAGLPALEGGDALERDLRAILAAELRPSVRRDAAWRERVGALLLVLGEAPVAFDDARELLQRGRAVLERDDAPR